MATLDGNFQSSVGHSLCMAAHSFERAMRDELAPEGITFRQCQVLAWLAIEAAELSQAELAERMNIEPQTLVSVLDRMERDGLVAREAWAGDRRKKLVRALPKADEVWARIIACAARVRESAFRGLSELELETLRGLLDRVRENLSRRAESS